MKTEIRLKREDNGTGFPLEVILRRENLLEEYGRDPAGYGAELSALITLLEGAAGAAGTPWEERELQDAAAWLESNPESGGLTLELMRTEQGPVLVYDFL